MTRQVDLARNYLDEVIQKREIPGIQFLVAGENENHFEYYGGYKNIGEKLPVTPETTFMASSSSKALTAAAVLQLIEKGKVKLDSPLSSYFANHPYGAVTTLQLLNQTSGIPNPLPLKWVHLAETHNTFDEREALRRVLNKHKKLAFKSGERYAYSNISYWLLGKVIEEASGLLYCDYMRQYIFEPLGISKEELNCVIPDHEQHAQGYQKKYSLLGVLLYLLMDKALLSESESGRFCVRPVYMNGPAYGGLIGTVRGFGKFLSDQLRPNPVIFSKKTKDLFYSHQKNSIGEDIETTLGWHRGQVEGVSYYGKPGGGPGYRSNMRVYPSKGIATVWLANETGVSESTMNALSARLDHMFLDG